MPLYKFVYTGGLCQNMMPDGSKTSKRPDALQQGPLDRDTSSGRHIEVLPPPSPQVAAFTYTGAARWPTGSELMELSKSMSGAFWLG